MHFTDCEECTYIMNHRLADSMRTIIEELQIQQTTVHEV